MGFGLISLDTGEFVIILNQTNGSSERLTKRRSSYCCYEVHMAVQTKRVEKVFA